MCEIEVLFRKGLFTSCLKLINKAKKQAQTNELFDLNLNALFWERRLSLVHGKGRNELEIINEMEKMEKRIKLSNQFTKRYAEALALMRNLAVKRSEDVLAELWVKVDMTEQDNLPLICQVKTLQLKALGHFVKGNREQELLLNRNLIRLLDETQIYKNEYPLDYINTYSRILSITKEMDSEAFRAELVHFRAFENELQSVDDLRIKAQVFNYSFMMELSFYINRREYAEGSRLIGEVEHGFKKYRKVLAASSRLTLNYILAYLHFALGDFDCALSQCIYIERSFKETDRPQLYQFSRLLMILVHYHQGNESPARSMCQSVRYYFRKRRRENRVELAVLKYLNSPRSYWGDQKERLQNLRKRIESIEYSGAEKDVFKYFDFLLWIEAVIRKQPMESALAG